MNNYLINEKVTEGERNRNKSHCYSCGCRLEKGEGFAIWIPSRGRRYVCDRHYDTRGILPYHSNASNRQSGSDGIGTIKSTSLASKTIGVEIEVVQDGLTTSEFTSLRALCEVSFNVKMESDCTVSGEMPTDYMRGLATISKVLQSMEVHGLLNAVNNERCGAHIHVQCDDVPYIRRYYHSIFLPLAYYIEAMSTDIRVLYFGSDFREWATMIDEYTDALNHSNIFNTQHQNTLEFRLPRITSHEQYMRCLKFWREIVFTIDSYDLRKNADAVTRKAQAQKCGSELVKIAKKYYPY